MSAKRLGIVVGGGPAPGINAVISAATIQAINVGYEVWGFYDGFTNLISDKFDAEKHCKRLQIDCVARIHFDGGSILRTARANLLDSEALKKSSKVQPDPKKVAQALQNLTALQIDCLLTIGGDDTALSARFLSEAAGDRLRSVHCPKTIDNDLPLPGNTPTFGFSTARYVGATIVKNLMQDSRSTNRWYFCNCMGRSAGWLALSIGMSAGATVTLIPEEFEHRTSVAALADILEGSILKRRWMGRQDGVAVVAEGVAYRLGDKEELEKLLNRPVPVDAAGHPRLSEVPLIQWVKDEVERRFAERGEKLTIVTHNIGYELRSADPTPGDMEYCRGLGFHSIRLFDSPDCCNGGVMVTIRGGNVEPIRLSAAINPDTNRVSVRTVDMASDIYDVARAYMIRLEERDLADPDRLRGIAEIAKMSPEDFRTRYAQAAQRPGARRHA
jgi:6-phosphofructokinase